MPKISNVIQILFIAGISILAALCSFSSLVQAGQLYRYIGENGTQMLSGNLPPEAVQGGYEIINSQTMVVVKRVPPAKTQKQLVEEARLAQIEAEKRQRAQEQEDYNHMLLATFGSEADLLRIRDSQIGAIEGAIRLVQSKIKTLQQALRERQNQAAHLERNGQTIPEQLLTGIQNVKAHLVRNQRYIAKKRQEQVAIKEKFTEDLKRFQELTQSRGHLPSF
ncbi:hypothetical protein [Nitrosococcus watsonii]|uniref:DUF4124 domain-containing protein n=1 Tax=Nitrosococcus watsoni (strain C-113) TaxID=105559 RepID=D8KCA2_NITWC|nr:hypothetical protein [Nitrosococcus watsonii]ADJ29773.1 conserved hypothetical protein [Nitrosococcus watsonii C-113]